MATTPLLQRGNGGSTPSGTTRTIGGAESEWSASVWGACLPCKQEGRARLSGGPSPERKRKGPRVRRRHASVVRRGTEFDSRADLGSSDHSRMGGWSNGMTPGLHPGATPEGFPPGSTPRPVHSTALYSWAAGPTGRHRHRTPGIGVRLPGGPLHCTVLYCTDSLGRSRSDEASGPSPNGRVPPWRGGDPGSTPGGSIPDRADLGR